MPIVIAVVLGPLVAGLAVCLLAVGNSIIDQDDWSQSADLRGLSVLYMIFAYLIGGVIALLAGISVSIWMIWHRPNAIVVNAAAVIATVLFMGVGASGFLGLVEETNARSNFVFILVLAVIAANVCWLLTRRFARTL